MKTTIEVNGFEIKIEEMDGKIMVSAMKDDEVVEEFELESEGMEGDEDFDGEEMEGDDDMSAFGEEDMEEEGDFDEEDMDEEDMDEEGEDMEEMEGDEEGKLESFNHFVKRRKK
jgi:hypothetical protein